MTIGAGARGADAVPDTSSAPRSGVDIAVVAPQTAAIGTASRGEAAAAPNPSTAAQGQWLPHNPSVAAEEKAKKKREEAQQAARAGSTMQLEDVVDSEVEGKVRAVHGRARLTLCKPCENCQACMGARACAGLYKVHQGA